MLPCSAVRFRECSFIAFDNDGTLYPSGEAVGQAVLTAHREYVERHHLGIPTPEPEWVRAMIGGDAKDFYQAMMPGMSPEVQRDFEEFCLDYETETVQRFPGLYVGAEELLAALRARAKTMVLVSNGSPRYVQSVWEAAGLGRFMVAMYPYVQPEALTKGQRLAQALREWGGRMNGELFPAVMVGDRASDLQAAREAGTLFIGCAYGYGDSSELVGADAVVQSIGELSGLLIGEEEL
jgi:phosphoglycolate phosphatase